MLKITPAVGTIKVLQPFNPYYQNAKPDAQTVDKGWKAIFIGSSGNDYIFGDDFSDTMYGYAGHDGLVGNGGKDYLYGGEGNDTFIGGAGADEMFGEEGDDFFWGELDGNTIDGGDGFDTVSYADIEQGVTVLLNMGYAIKTDKFFANESLTNIEQIIGSVHDDIIVGDNLLAGNSLLGGSGNDVIDGQAGADTIVGGRGADELWGGLSNDTFIFNLGDSPGVNGNFDTIKDFNLHDDVMQFQVYDPSKTEWFAYEGTVDGAAGTWVRIAEMQFTQTSAEYVTLHQVFLEGKSIASVSEQDILLV